MPLRPLLLAGTLSMFISQSANAAAPPHQPNSGQLQLALRKLGVVGSVLYVAAHPDDENTNLIAYLANDLLVRTGYLSITRGDGGQNLIGSEQGAELGVIRTQELLAARRVDGGEQWFTRARDFGYSKTPEETLRLWGKDAVLADVVLAIRRFRPDVIISRFSPEPSETHGHHTASAMLTREAFRAAADPKFHPEQLKDGVEPWQAKRLLWNRSTWNLKAGEDLSAFLSLDVGTYSPLLGVSTGELAADSRSMHKSQGFGVARTRGPILEYFKVLDEVTKTKTRGIFDGLDFSWRRFAGAARLTTLVNQAARQFTPGAPHTILPTLLDYDAALDRAPDVSWRAQKKNEVRELMLACAGLFTEATATDFRVAPGVEIEIKAVALNRSPTPFSLKQIRWPDGAIDKVDKTLATATDGTGGGFETKKTKRVPPELSPTTPYWLRLPPEAGLYQVDDPKNIGIPEGVPSLQVEWTFEVGPKARRRALTVSRPVTFKWTDPVAGERYRPLEVTPAVSVRPETSILLFADDRPKTLRVRLSAGAPAQTGALRAELSPGWSAEPASIPFSLRAKGDEVEVVFQIRPAPAKQKTSPASPGALRLIAEVGAQKHSRGVIRIEHPHIPIQTLLTDAQVNLVPLLLEKGGTKIGYIPGPGDEVPASLSRVGYEVTLLGDAALAAGPAALGRFDAIVVGVRAYNTNDRLRAAHATLMAYVSGGGTLLVQYNTNNRLSPLSTPMGPWPFEIGRDRVTDEGAPVTLSAPAHPALTTPNRISARDFDGWIQERGLYFASSWDSHYERMVAMNDPGEKPLAGGVLWARHGKGTFVYTGLAFFRQLPAGVPGAYRLFANLLAGGKPSRAR